MKPLLFDVRSLLKNSFYIKEQRSKNLNDQYHFHNSYEITLILKGNGRKVIGDIINNFSDGDLLVLGPNLPHASYSDQKYHVRETGSVHSLVIYFQPDWFTAEAMGSIEMNQLKEFLKRIKRGVEFFGRTRIAVRNQVLKLKSEADGFKRFVIFMQILQELASSAEYNYLASAGYSNKSTEKDIHKMDQVYKYVMENFSEKIFIDEVAAIAFMSPSAFCKYFKRKTSKTFTNFVNEIRVSYACELLMNKDIEIANICFQCGFNNFTSFNKCFKTITKLTPSEYRTTIHSMH